MITAMQLTDSLKSYLLMQLDNMSKNTPVIGFAKPIIVRILDKNFNKIHKAIDLIADSNGNIDIENILSEMLDNIKTTEPFTLNTSFMGDIEIGGGVIKLNIPLTSKRIVLDSADFEAFKEMLLTKS